MEHSPKFLLGTQENRRYLQEQAMELWRFASRFPSPGGSAYYLKDDGAPWPEKNRETYETCRMIHCYCMGRALGFPGSYALVDAGMQALLGELRDTVSGGWYSALRPDGTPVPGKLCYAHAFVILAASSATQAGHPEGPRLLREALDFFEQRFWDEDAEMTYDNWNTDFTVLDSYRGINANMHSVEAFLAAADVTREEIWRSWAGQIIDRVLGWAEQNNWRIPEHYTADWSPDLECNAHKPDDQFKPYGATPGHGMEWARLIVQWTLSTYPRGATPHKRYIGAAEKLFERAVEDGWNADGATGFVYTTDWEGKPIVHDRMQWTLAEGISAAAVLFRFTQKEQYAAFYSAFLEYLEASVRDHTHGSWFHQLDRNNRKIDTVWPGKPDIYHALQAMLIPYYSPAVSIVPAIFQREEYGY